MDQGSVTAGISSVIDRKREEIIAFGEEIYNHPETGFKEFRTAQLVADKFRGMGLSVTQPEDIPGVKATVDTGREGPGVAILGELDAVVCTGHPHCSSATGAVHACGHNIQTAAMLGAAIGILNLGLTDRMSGKIHFIAVPAEEYIEIADRLELRNKKVIKYLAGKPELLYRGFFDDVDTCVMIHSYPMNGRVRLESSTNGFLVKNINFTGRAAHAGYAPYDGINALYAANMGMMAVNAIRETFNERDYVRVHPIITKGGETVNVIPSEVRVETYIRAKTMEAIMDVSSKVDRAMAGGAYALGAKAEITTMPGYFPFTMDSRLTSAALKSVQELTGEEDIPVSGHSSGSTDLGDLSTLMPVIEIGTGGITGGLHSADYRIADKDASYLLSSKILAVLTARLLENGALLAREAVSGYSPIFESKQEYFRFVDGLYETKLLP